ncbi:MAG: hypothetical protein SW127_10760 [Actinomycetota bacterium]|nr:hypothetical protein [Actinomycetota bacterium]
MARLAHTVLGGLGGQIDTEPAELGARNQRAVLAQLLLPSSVLLTRGAGYTLIADDADVDCFPCRIRRAP